jgi:hypothetical protein
MSNFHLGESSPGCLSLRLNSRRIAITPHIKLLMTHKVDKQRPKIEFCIIKYKAGLRLAAGVGGYFGLGSDPTNQPTFGAQREGEGSSTTQVPQSTSPSLRSTSPALRLTYTAYNIGAIILFKINIGATRRVRYPSNRRHGKSWTPA